MIKNKKNTPSSPSIAFFGTSEFSVFVLEQLKKNSLLPNLVVTMPDKPQGRRLTIMPPPAKIWADKNDIETIQPENIKTKEFERELKEKTSKGWDLFIVASYGKIIPENILYMPKRKTLNVHPSLLPLLRGAAPLERSILANMQKTGVTVILLDKEMDHGPIICQKEVAIEPWPIDRIELEKKLGTLGGTLLAETIPAWIAGNIKEVEQDHSKATYAPKITKEEGLIDLMDDCHKNLLKIKAFAGWPKAYFFDTKGDSGKKTRIIINDAEVRDEKLILLKITPEGKREMTWKEYCAGKN